MTEQEYRIEKDFLGEKQVPKEAYYGVQTLRAAENFPITGFHIDPSLIAAMALVKKAAARANFEIGRLDEVKAKAIMEASDEIIAGKLHDQFLTDPIQGGAGTSVNMNANEVIANRALEIMGEEKGHYQALSPNTHVNMAQSTNDAFPSAVHIAVLMRLESLLEAMSSLHAEFKRKAVEFDGMIKMGRTHLQDAIPIRLGQEFEAYACLVERDINRIKATRACLHEVNLGATAVGTGLNADPVYIEKANKYLAQYSELPLRGSSNLVDGTQNIDCYMEVSSSLKNCMLALSKVMNDLRLMASGPRCGLAEINLPPRQPGSSIMPGKVNPVMAEVMNQVAFQVAGNDLTISLACEGGQFELNVMEPVLVFNLLQSISVMTNVFTAFRKYCLSGISANEERMRDYVDNSVGIITAINPHVGYEVAAGVAKEAIANNLSVRDLIISKGILTEKELDIIMDPSEMTRPGIAGKELLANK